ncbi:response regulator [Candidatus Acetothermia bacterium]|nr:response regulator [Candidatus Acetothermia bacterium]MCI2427995.1 response regulator [Candidatus Acetothermia bacterium]
MQNSLSQKIRMKVLVVEDSPTDVKIIERTMKRSAIKCDLFFVVDGKAALDFLFQRGNFSTVPRPDLILLDLNLPKIDGFEVLKEIKQDQQLRRIPVIVLTISTREEDAVRAYDSGAASYMSKPVNSEDFEKLITTVQEYWRIATLPKS